MLTIEIVDRRGTGQLDLADHDLMLVCLALARLFPLTASLGHPVSDLIEPHAPVLLIALASGFNQRTRRGFIIFKIGKLSCLSG